MSLSVKVAIVRGGFSLDVDEVISTQGVTGVFGPSGCGKTTLLRAIAGLETAGERGISFAGDVWDSERARLAVARREVGYVAQGAALFSHLTVLGNVRFGWKRCVRKDVSPDEAIEWMGLGALRDRAVGSLSGGQRQRVAIARALAANPRLLLMDEPLEGLDREARAGILHRLERLGDRVGIPIIYVTHSGGELVRLADSVLLMKEGRVVARGGVQEVFREVRSGVFDGVVVDGQVRLWDGEHLCATVRSGECDLVLPLSDVTEVGVAVRLRVAAGDVSLTLSDPGRTSILNCLAGEVVDVVKDAGSVVVRVRCSGLILHARISTLSAAKLAIEPGVHLWAQVKGLALADGE